MCIYGQHKPIRFVHCKTRAINIAGTLYGGELFVIASSNAFIKVWKANAHDVGRIEIKYIGSGATDVYKRAATDSEFVKV